MWTSIGKGSPRREDNKWKENKDINKDGSRLYEYNLVNWVNLTQFTVQVSNKC